MLLMLDTMMIDRKIENIGFSNKTWFFSLPIKKTVSVFEGIYIYTHTDTHIHGMSRLSRMCVSNTESCFSTTNEVILLTIFSKSRYLDSQ